MAKKPATPPAEAKARAQMISSAAGRAAEMRYEYKARLVRAVDGDTAVFDVDVGFGVTMRHRTRLLGINTPERGQDGYEAAKGALFELCADRQLIIKTHKDKGDKYGRYLAEIAVLSATGEITVPSVAAKLIADGMGVEYSGMEYMRRG